MELDGEMNALGDRDSSCSTIIVEGDRGKKERDRKIRTRMRQTEFEISNPCKRLVDRSFPRSADRRSPEGD